MRRPRARRGRAWIRGRGRGRRRRRAPARGRARRAGRPRREPRGEVAHRGHRAGHQPGAARRRTARAAARLRRGGARPASSWSPSTRGPGMRDMHALGRTTAQSTAGTLGIGLGAVHRLASACDATRSRSARHRHRRAVLAGPARGPPPAGGRARPRRSRARRCAGTPTPTAPIDGAAPAAGQRRPRARPAGRRGLRRAAPRASATPPRSPPPSCCERMHRRVPRTRGAAAAVAHARPDGRPGDLRRRRQHRRPDRRGTAAAAAWCPLPGIVGHNLRDGHATCDYDARARAPGGAAQRRPHRQVGPRALPRPARPRPAVVAATLMRDAAVRRDDASVLVCRVGGR